MSGRGAVDLCPRLSKSHWICVERVSATSGEYADPRRHLRAAGDRPHLDLRHHERRELHPRRIVYVWRLRDVHRGAAARVEFLPGATPRRYRRLGTRCGYRADIAAALAGFRYRYDHAGDDRSLDRHAIGHALDLGRCGEVRRDALPGLTAGPC